MENSIKKDIKIIEDFILKTDVDYSEYNEQIVGDISYQAIQHLLSAYQEVLKENDCLKNHVHYKNCIACGNEFRCKRSDTKYCTNCSKIVSNKNYFANLTEEQKEKRREKVKLAMRKLRANKK